AVREGEADGSLPRRESPQARLRRLRRPLMQPRLPFDRIPNPEPQVPTLFVRHPRARRYVIRVTDEGNVRVTIPRWGSKRDATAFVASQHAWIAKQLARLDSSTGPGQILSSNSGRAVDREAWARAKRELPPRLFELAARHGLAVSRVSVRNQQWRW